MYMVNYKTKSKNSYWRCYRWDND